MPRYVRLEEGVFNAGGGAWFQITTSTSRDITLDFFDPASA